MPSILITTSRRTSGRVRSFTHDLMTVLPNSERFNRGGMSHAELVARTKQSGARALIIVTSSRGNPRELEILSPAGDTILSALIESMQLRREVLASQGPRINGLREIVVSSSPGRQTQQIADLMSSLLETPLSRSGKVVQVGGEGANRAIMRFEDLPQDRLIWTCYHASDGVEIGPRVRIFSVRRHLSNEP